jgi:hypothetical protein
LDVEIVMDLVKYLESGKEKDRAPWTVALGQLRQIEDLIQDTDMLDTFQVILLVIVYILGLFLMLKLCNLNQSSPVKKTHG